MNAKILVPVVLVVLAALGAAFIPVEDRVAACALLCPTDQGDR